MTIKDFSLSLAKKQAELNQLVRDKLPVMVGAMAKRHFQDSFRNSGFTDTALQPWPRSRRLSDGSGSARDQSPTLLSSRKNLFGSINYITRPAAVRVFTNLKYAAIHNEGGSIPITPKMRRFAWAKYYQEAGIERKSKTLFGSSAQTKSAKKPIPPQAERWKRMALTKKTSIVIPKRQFIGDSAVLRRNINKKIDTEVRKILNNNG